MAENKSKPESLKQQRSEPVYDNPSAERQTERGTGRTIAAFVLGIASIAVCFAPFMLIAAVVGLLLEKDAEREGYHHLQRPARILCIIGIILCSLVIIAIIVVLLTAGILSRG